MRYIVKITWTAGQCRITIPKGLVTELELDDIEYMTLEKVGNKQILIRRLLHGDDFKRQETDG